jgi:uncharacterized membrane protein (DUF373 family)
MERDTDSRSRIFRETRDRWPVMTAYERFEQIVALLLSVVIAVVIVIASFQLYRQVLPVVLSGAVDLLDQQVFHTLFGAFMTLLIAMEFKHSIIRVALRRGSVIQVKTVVLIALLALSRKFLILDVDTTSAATSRPLAAATLVLGLVYWLLRRVEETAPG